MTQVHLRVRCLDTAPAPVNIVPSEGAGAHFTRPPAGQRRVCGYSRLPAVNRGERWNDIANVEHTLNDMARMSATTSQTHVIVNGRGWPLGQTGIDVVEDAYGCSSDVLGLSSSSSSCAVSGHRPVREPESVELAEKKGGTRTCQPDGGCTTSPAAIPSSSKPSVLLTRLIVVRVIGVIVIRVVLVVIVILVLVIQLDDTVIETV